MVAVQFGININNFFFGAGAANVPAAQSNPTASALPVAQLPAALPATQIAASAPVQTSLAQTSPAQGAVDAAALPADLQRAGLGLGGNDAFGLTHIVTNATSSLASQAGVDALAAGTAGSFDPAALFGAGGLSALTSGSAGVPVVLVPVFLNAQGGFALGPVPAFPTTGPVPGAIPAVGDQTSAPVVESPVSPDAPVDAELIDVDAPVVPTAPAPESVAVPDLPESTTTIIQVPPEAFDAALQNANRSSVDTELTLSLLTQDGDEIQLDFRQLDLLVQLGDDDTGERDSQTERLVDISITGSLDDAERAALDGVIASVIDIAEQFLAGDLDATRTAIQDLDFDTSELAELSLRLSVARSVTVDQAYGGDLASFAALTETSSNAAAVLEFFANEQRTLIDSARDVLSDASSVRLVAELLPALISEPLTELAQRIDTQAVLDDTAAVVDTPEELVTP